MQRRGSHGLLSQGDDAMIFLKNFMGVALLKNYLSACAINNGDRKIDKKVLFNTRRQNKGVLYV